MSEKLKVRIGGKNNELTVNSFIEVIESSYGLLSHLSGSSVTWIVGDVSRNSPVSFEFIATDGGQASVAIHRFRGGMDALSRKTDPSEYFDDKAQKLARKMSGLLANGVSDVSFDIGEDHFEVPEDISYLDPIQEVEPYYAFAELEGVFGKLDFHGGHEDFIIYDRITGRPVACDFSGLDVSLADLIQYARRRLRVTGQTRFNRQHQPTKVTVATFEAVGEAVPLKELHKAKFSVSGELSAEQIIRNLRRLDA